MTDILSLCKIYIEGDKTGFLTKNSIERFKKNIKLSQDFDLNILKKEYIKYDYDINIIDKNENYIKFNIFKQNITTCNDISSDEKRTELKKKIKINY